MFWEEDYGDLLSGCGEYPPDKPHLPLVIAAKSGNVTTVRKLIKEAKTKRKTKNDRAFAKFVNGTRIWTEVQDKCGYDKTWDWYDDTALIAAARIGHVEIVKILLLTGECDPTLQSCPKDDVYENAHEAVLNAKKQYSSRNNTIDGNSNEIVQEMLNIANLYWDTASYKNACAGSRKEFTNRIKCDTEQDLVTYRKEIEAVASKFKSVNDAAKNSTSLFPLSIKISGAKAEQTSS